jgi:serine/threonine protein kinase
VGTVPARLIGTPVYSSPELALKGLVRPAADVWALGLTVWELVSGHRLTTLARRLANRDDLEDLEEFLCDPLKVNDVQCQMMVARILHRGVTDAWFTDPVWQTNVFREAMRRYIEWSLDPNPATRPSAAELAGFCAVTWDLHVKSALKCDPEVSSASRKSGKSADLVDRIDIGATAA